MVSKKVPKCLWDYGLVHHAGILSRIYRGKIGLTGIEEVTGHMPDISEWLDFEFYNQVWWLDKKHPSTMGDNIILLRWIGISHIIGSAMSYWILMVSVKLIAQTTVQHMIHTELFYTYMKVWIDIFDEDLEKQLDDVKFMDDARADLYINKMNGADEAAHRDVYNTLINEAYGDIMVEERPKQDII